MNKVGQVTTLIGVSLLSVVLTYAARGIQTSNEPAAVTGKQTTSAPKAGSAVPVLVELFTSEGCSSCPPADMLLATLAKAAAVNGAQVIPLEEHVDYWNHLGWADPFSNSRFTNRQRSYIQLMRLNQVYTPQMVVDGRKEMLGSDEQAARAAITESARSPKARVMLTAASQKDGDASLNVRIDPFKSDYPGEQMDVVVAITEDNLQSTVTQGENAGRSLPHIGVVRSWKVIGNLNGKEPYSNTIVDSLDSNWKRSNLHAVLFVQGHDSGKVYGAATTTIEPVHR